MSKPYQVLLVEDDPDHVELLRRALELSKRSFEMIWKDSIRAAQQWLAENTPDLLLTDLYLPDGSGKVFLNHAPSALPYPVIIQTAYGDEQKAVEMIKAGAYDYLPKRFDLLNELPYVLERAIEEWRHQRQKQELEARLQAGQSVFQVIFENAPAGILFFNAQGIVQAVNGVWAEILKIPRESLIGLNLLDFPYENIRSAVQRTLQGESFWQEEDFRQQPFGIGSALRAYHAPVRLPDGQGIGGVVLIQDITAQKNEQDLQQALYQIANLAHQTRSAEQLYEGIHGIVKTILPAENFYIALWDKAAQRLYFPYWVDQYDPNPGIVPLQKGLTEYVLRTGQTVLTEDERVNEMKARGEIERLGTPSQAWLGAPLKDAAGEVFGAVVVQTYDPNMRYLPHHVHVLEYIASQIGLVLQRFNLEEQERHQRRLAQALLEATAALSESLELAQVFERILTQLYLLTHYDNATITLIDGEWVTLLRTSKPARCDGRILKLFGKFTAAALPCSSRKPISIQNGRK